MSVCMGLHMCVIDLYVCGVLGLYDLMFPSVCLCAIHLYLWICIRVCVCAYALVCIYVCVRACACWQGFKEMFLLRPSLICPAEYRELLKGYYTTEPRPSWRLSQHLKSPRAATALTIWSFFRRSCKQIEGKWDLALIPINANRPCFYMAALLFFFICLNTSLSTKPGVSDSLFWDLPLENYWNRTKEIIFIPCVLFGDHITHSTTWLLTV